MVDHRITRPVLGSLILAGAWLSAPAMAADYVIDTEGAHASINFRISHLGYSWLTGRFNDFSGQFSYDADNPEAASISVILIRPALIPITPNAMSICAATTFWRSSPIRRPVSSAPTTSPTATARPRSRASSRCAV